ncbi:MAG: hypothetical protein KBE09_05715 [Candidatus Pacebacteria bacterium]|nr:hypothetical protein [Candidatus Paceibacterota bacterium]
MPILSSLAKLALQLIIGLMVVALVGILYVVGRSLYVGEAPTWLFPKEASLSNLQEEVRDGMLTDKIPTSEAFKDFAGAETGTKYKHLEEELATMRADLEKTAATDSISEMLYKRAIFYKNLASMANVNMEGPEKEALILEAYDGLHENIMRIPEVLENDKRNPRYLRRLYVHVVLHAYRNTNDASIFARSTFLNEPAFQRLLNQYKQNPDIASVLFILDELASKEDLSRDNLMVADRMYHLARLLNYRETAFDETLRNRIYLEVAELAALYPTARESILYSSPQENKARPAAYFAMSLGIAARYMNSPITIEMAKEAYNAAYAMLAQHAVSEEDSLHVLKFGVDTTYAALLLHENDGRITPEISTVFRDIESVATRYENNPEMTRVYRNILTAAQQPRGIWNLAVRDLVDASKNDAQLAAFLAASGVVR